MDTGAESRRRHWRRGNRGKHPQQQQRRSLPKFWINVANAGQVVPGTCIIPAKVPLDPSKYASEWTPTSLLAYFREEQVDTNINVKMVIDLTNTTKYYDGPRVFSDLKYVKLPCDGFNHPPKDREIHRFFRHVSDFQRTHPNSHLVLHCTHGLNRTGYFIVQYLIEFCHLKVSKALEVFATARPPGIVKFAYIEALYRQFGDPNEPVMYPDLPDWAQAKYGKKNTATAFKNN